jgi:hypothetical protein
MITEKNEKFIPPGLYCYHLISGPDEKMCFKTLVCPYWGKRLDKPEQESGYCHFLGKGDWEKDGTFLLWDQCKECGINTCDDYGWKENSSEIIRHNEQILEWAENMIPIISDEKHKQEVLSWIEKRLEQ